MHESAQFIFNSAFAKMFHGRVRFPKIGVQLWSSTGTYQNRPEDKYISLALRTSVTPLNIFRFLHTVLIAY